MRWSRREGVCHSRQIKVAPRASDAPQTTWRELRRGGLYRRGGRKRRKRTKRSGKALTMKLDHSVFCVLGWSSLWKKKLVGGIGGRIPRCLHASENGVGRRDMRCPMDDPFRRRVMPADRGGRAEPRNRRSRPGGAVYPVVGERHRRLDDHDETDSIVSFLAAVQLQQIQTGKI